MVETNWEAGSNLRVSSAQQTLSRRRTLVARQKSARPHVIVSNRDWDENFETPKQLRFGRRQSSSTLALFRNHLESYCEKYWRLLAQRIYRWRCLKSSSSFIRCWNLNKGFSLRQLSVIDGRGWHRIAFVLGQEPTLLRCTKLKSVVARITTHLKHCQALKVRCCKLKKNLSEKK